MSEGPFRTLSSEPSSMVGLRDVDGSDRRL
jgi:hypothetical protein